MKKALRAIFGFVLTWLILFIFLRNPSLHHETTTVQSTSVSISELKNRVYHLSSITPARQYQHKDSLLAAETFIRSELEKMGYSVNTQDVVTEEGTFHNLSVRYGESSSQPAVVVGAHYDVCGDQPGADDNATGVAGVLEIARLLKDNKPSLNSNIEIVFYTLEEPPFFDTAKMGSAVHARQLKENGTQVKYMISLEMIGYFSEDLFSQKFVNALLYLFYPTRGNFIGIVGSTSDRGLVSTFKAAMIPNSSVPVFSINAPRFIPGIDYSDQKNYWDKGWPALMITDTAFLRNTQYHEIGDSADRLNYEKMAEVVRGVYSALIITNSNSVSSPP